MNEDGMVEVEFYTVKADEKNASRKRVDAFLADRRMPPEIVKGVSVFKIENALYTVVAFYLEAKTLKFVVLVEPHDEDFPVVLTKIRANNGLPDEPAPEDRRG